MLRTRISKVPWLWKMMGRGHRGYPVATVAFYGPDASRASKAVAAILGEDNRQLAEMRKWYSDDVDLRIDPDTINEVTEYIKSHGARSVAGLRRLIGCPHEEGIDYEGPTCPKCPYWADRDRWTGEGI